MVAWRVNWGGWVAPKPGNVRVRWGGWISPRRIYVKVPGGWADTGYSTTPGAPRNFGVTGWSFTVVNLGFWGPDGGEAPSYYEVAQNDSNDNRISTQYNTTGAVSFGVGQNGLYKFYVRSVAPNGLASAWVGPIRVGIGHDQQTAQRWAQRSYAWQSNKVQYGTYAGLVTGQTAEAYSGNYGFATGMYITDMHLEVWSSQGWTTTWGFYREMYWLGNGAADINGAMQRFDTTMVWGPSWAATPFRPRWSNGGAWGIWCAGSGYDNKYGAWYPIYEHVIIAGTYYYPELETYVTVNYQDNYYW